MTAQAPDFFSNPSVIADSRSYFDLMRLQAPVLREGF